MFTPAFFARVGVGLAATAVDQVVAAPGRAVEAGTAIAALPVRLAGSAARMYLGAGQRVTELAIRGDRVIEQVFPHRAEIPRWATFDEDLPPAEPRAGRLVGTTSGHATGDAASGRTRVARGPVRRPRG